MSTKQNDIIADNLSCEVCGDTFKTEGVGLVEEFESIQETKRCTACYSEFRDSWPDQI